MSTTRDELYKLLESLPDEKLSQVGDLVKVLVEEPDELTESEWAEVHKGEEEIQHGEWVRWEDVKRQDV